MKSIKIAALLVVSVAVALQHQSTGWAYAMAPQLVPPSAPVYSGEANPPPAAGSVDYLKFNTGIKADRDVVVDPNAPVRQVNIPIQVPIERVTDQKTADERPPIVVSRSGSSATMPPPGVTTGAAPGLASGLSSNYLIVPLAVVLATSMALRNAQNN